MKNRIVIEGTEEQIKNLMELINHGCLLNAYGWQKIICDDDDLPKVRLDFQTENLWSIEDVQRIFDCDDEDAMEVMESALTNEATMEQIWYAVRFEGEELGLKEKKYT